MIEASFTSPSIMFEIQRPESVVVAAIRSADVAAIRELLERGGFWSYVRDRTSDAQPGQVDQDEVGSPEKLTQWLTEHPDAHLLVVMSLPTVDVAWGLQQGRVPDATLTDWLGSAQALLEIIRPRRRRVSLVFAEAVLAAPQEFLERMSQRFGLQLRSVSSDGVSPDLPSALLRLIAERVISQSSQARDVAAELEATALPLSAAVRCRFPAIEQVFSEYRDGVEATSVLQEMREEKEMLLQQLDQVQKELEQRHLQSIERAKEMQQLHHRLQVAEEHLSTVEQEKTEQLQEDFREENELLLSQVHQLQEELEREHLQGLQNSKELVELRRHLQGANETIEALYSSKSWKITKPLRMMLDLFAGGKKAS